MSREVHYKQGYRIIISNGFYEVVNGRCVEFYGQMSRPTLQSVWDRTVRVQQAEEYERWKQEHPLNIEETKVDYGNCRARN